MTPTAFASAAVDAASIFTAATQTIRYVHAEPARLTVEYGEGSMINYSEQVSDLPGELPALDGAPDPATVEGLVALVEPAAADLGQPCLREGCDWEAQAGRIEAAAQALLQAAE